jgi:hypothetical protein
VDVLSLDDLVAAFRACTLPKAAWTHHAHLRVGTWHVHHHGPAAALPLLRAGIRRLNDSHGTVNSAMSGYHETITAAYVLLLDEFLRAFDADVPLDRRADLLVDTPLADRAALLSFWSRDLLMSERARAEWVPPDLAPLALPAAVRERLGR